MHKLSEQEKLIKAEAAYCRGLMRSEMRVYGFRAIHSWAQRYRVAMQLSQAKKRDKVQKEKGKSHERDTAKGDE